MPTTMRFDCSLNYFASFKAKPGIFFKLPIVKCEFDVRTLTQNKRVSEVYLERLKLPTVVPHTTPSTAPSSEITAQFGTVIVSLSGIPT
jgi:hypothetical protein